MTTKICTICARGGSKGVKNKNIRLLNGVPLIAHSIQKALESQIFDTVAVSSDCDDILNISSKFGAHHVIKRPAELATDKAAKIPVIRHAVQTIENITNKSYDVCVDLDATSPLRTAEDIKNAFIKFQDDHASILFSVCRAHRSPYFNLVEESKDGKISLSKKSIVTRRQDAPECYDMNASIYIWKRDIIENENSLFLDETSIYVMPTERSFDIDTELDFKIVEFLMGHNSNESIDK